MKENNDLMIYRNVYKKLLLRTRNSKYEKEFEQLKEKINNGEITQEENIKWLNKP